MEGAIYQNFTSIQRPIPLQPSFAKGDSSAPMLPPKQHQPPPYRPAPLPLQLLPSLMPPPMMPPIAEDNVYLNNNGNGATFHLGPTSGKFFATPTGTACSSEGSHDSHNDSGYGIRPGGGGGSVSGGPSPSLSGGKKLKLNSYTNIEK
jgi:hypothetical protein